MAVWAWHRIGYRYRHLERARPSEDRSELDLQSSSTDNAEEQPQ